MGSLSVIWNWIADHASVLATVVSALAAVAVGAFTYFLVRVTNRQAELTRAGIALETRQFTAAYPPELVIHSLERLQNDENGMRNVEVRYINVGATEATIVEIAGFTVDAGEPLPSGIQLPVIQKAAGHVGRGRDDTFLITEVVEDVVGAANMFDEYFLFCIGRVIYEDATGRQRRTGLCRKWEPNHGEWQKVDNPEYEYSY